MSYATDILVVMPAANAIGTLDMALISTQHCIAHDEGRLHIVVCPLDDIDYSPHCHRPGVTLLPLVEDEVYSDTINRAVNLFSFNWITVIHASDWVSSGYIDDLMIAANKSNIKVAFSLPTYTLGGYILRDLSSVVPTHPYSSNELFYDASIITEWHLSQWAGLIFFLCHSSLWCNYPNIREADLFVAAQLLGAAGGAGALVGCRYFRESFVDAADATTLQSGCMEAMSITACKEVTSTFASRLTFSIAYQNFIAAGGVGCIQKMLALNSHMA